MAYKVNVTQGTQAAGASYTVVNGAHITGDLLLNYLVKDADESAATNSSIGFANSVATIIAAADTVGYAGSDVWTDGDQVTFTGTALPGGLTNEVRYFIRDLDTGANTFKVAATAGGAAIDITSTGTAVTVTQVTAGANSPYNGWQIIGTQAVNLGQRSVWAFKVAASAAEGNVTYVAGSNDWIGSSYTYRDAHATAPFGSLVDGTDFARAAWGDAATGASAAITTAVDGCLLLYSWGIDGNSRYGRCALNDLTALDKYSASNVNYIVGYRQQQTAGAAPSVTMYDDASTEGGATWTLAIRNKSGGSLQPDIRPDINELKWYGTWNEEHDGSTTWNKPSTFCSGVTDFGGIVLSATNPTVANNSTAVDKFIWNAYLTGLASTEDITLLAGEAGLGAWVGGWHTIPSTDLTGKMVGCMWETSASSGSAQQGSEGILIGFSDDTNCVLYQVTTKKFGWLGTNGEFAFVAAGNATAYDSVGTVSTVIAACTRFGLFRHRITNSTTTQSVYIRDLAVFGTTALTGGGVNIPARFQDFQEAITSWGQWDFARLTGSAQVLAKSSVQIGDGTNATYFDGAAQSVEFPQAWSATMVNNWQMNWNALSNSVGLSIKAKAGDTINLASGVAATDTAQNLSINASSAAAADATYSFAQSFVGWSDPIDNKGLGWSGATFKECGIVTIAGGGDLTNCSISKTTSTNAALAITANGSVLTSTSITVADAAVSTGYHLELGTAVTAITLADVTFSGTPGTDKVHVLKTAATVTAGSFVTGDHYEIKTVGTTDFTLIGASANTIGVRFTATGAGSGTGDAYVAVKITISGTTSLADSDVTSAGAIVWVAAPSPTLDATVLSGSRVVLYNDTTAAELDNTAPAGTSWSKVITSGASSGDTLTLHVFKEGYEEFSTSFIYAGIDNTLLVTQAVHAAIASLRTEFGITDYTTITEFSLDITGTVEIDADDADGSTTKARLAIWYNGVLTTENGARYLRGAISVLSTAAIRINTSVLDLKIENISVTYGLNFTDTERRLYRDDGAAIYAAASAPGSIQNDYSGVPDTVTTSDQSLNLATAEQAIDNKLSSISSGVWAYVVTGSTTAVQMMRGFAAMLLGKVSGAGTTTEVFRDIEDTKDVATFTVDSSGNRTAVTRDLT